MTQIEYTRKDFLSKMISYIGIATPILFIAKNPVSNTIENAANDLVNKPDLTQKQKDIISKSQKKTLRKDISMGLTLPPFFSFVFSPVRSDKEKQAFNRRAFFKTGLRIVTISTVLGAATKSTHESTLSKKHFENKQEPKADELYLKIPKETPQKTKRTLIEESGSNTGLFVGLSSLFSQAVWHFSGRKWHVNEHDIKDPADLDTPNPNF